MKYQHIEKNKCIEKENKNEYVYLKKELGMKISQR